VALHRAASEWLLIVGEEDIGTIARHAEAGEDFARAAVLFARASGQAYANGQLEAALDFADASIRCGTDAATQAQALFLRAQILSWLGRYDDQREAAESAISHAEPGTDTWGEAQRLAASALREIGRPSEAESRFAWVLDNPRFAQMTLETQSKLHAERTRACSGCAPVKASPCTTSECASPVSTISTVPSSSSERRGRSARRPTAIASSSTPGFTRRRCSPGGASPETFATRTS